MVFAIVFSPNKVLFAGLACGLCRNLLLEGFGLQLSGAKITIARPKAKPRNPSSDGSELEGWGS
jgi:hypothetical protein